jgi:NitT/TauT family transport system permease protein
LAAIALSLSELLRRAVLPFAIFFQTVPIIAIAPLLVIYFGFGLNTVVASATIVSIFPVLASALIALTSTPEGDLELFRLYRAGRWKTLWNLQLPAAYLGIYTGLRVAAGLAVIGAVVGEFVSGGGLGSMIDSARTQQRIDIVFAAILLLSLIGLALINVLRSIHKLIQTVRPFGLDLKE